MTREARRKAENVPFMLIRDPHNLNLYPGQRVQALEGERVIVKIQSIKSRKDGRLEIIGTSRPVKNKGDKE